MSRGGRGGGRGAPGGRGGSRGAPRGGRGGRGGARGGKAGPGGTLQLRDKGTLSASKLKLSVCRRRRKSGRRATPTCRNLCRKGQGAPASHTQHRTWRVCLRREAYQYRDRRCRGRCRCYEEQNRIPSMESFPKQVGSWCSWWSRQYSHRTWQEGPLSRSCERNFSLACSRRCWTGQSQMRKRIWIYC